MPDRRSNAVKRSARRCSSSARSRPVGINIPCSPTQRSDFLLWLVPALERFPRSQKFLLGDRIQGMALDTLESLIEATHTRQRGGHLGRAIWGSRSSASCCVWRATCAIWTGAATSTPPVPWTIPGAVSARDLFDGLASFAALHAAVLLAARGKRAKPGDAASWPISEVLRLERELHPTAPPATFPRTAPPARARAAAAGPLGPR